MVMMMVMKLGPDDWRPYSWYWIQWWSLAFNWGLICLGLCFRLITLATGQPVILIRIRVGVRRIFNLLSLCKGLPGVIEVEITKRWKIGEISRWNRQDLMTYFRCEEKHETRRDSQVSSWGDWEDTDTAEIVNTIQVVFHVQWNFM